MERLVAMRGSSESIGTNLLSTAEQNTACSHLAELKDLYVFSEHLSYTLCNVRWIFTVAVFTLEALFMRPEK